MNEFHLGSSSNTKLPCHITLKLKLNISVRMRTACIEYSWIVCRTIKQPISVYLAFEYNLINDIDICMFGWFSVGNQRLTCILCSHPTGTVTRSSTLPECRHSRHITYRTAAFIDFFEWHSRQAATHPMVYRKYKLCPSEFRLFSVSQWMWVKFEKQL